VTTLLLPLVRQLKVEGLATVNAWQHIWHKLLVLPGYLVSEPSSHQKKKKKPSSHQMLLPELQHPITSLVEPGSRTRTSASGVAVFRGLKSLLAKSLVKSLGTLVVRMAFEAVRNLT
jgi:hypothetical protein